MAGDYNAKLELSIQRNNIKQKESRNGRMLRETVEDTETIAVNINPKDCERTRENRNNSSEKSVIDYIVTTRDVANNIEHLKVDIEGTYRIKGKKESDHNTILITVKCDIHQTTERKKI